MISLNISAVPRPTTKSPAAPCDAGLESVRPSSRLWQSLTSRVRTSSATAPRLPDAYQSCLLRLVRRGISRFPSNELPHMPGSSTTPGRLDARFHAPTRVAFRIRNGVGTRDKIFARLNGWPVCSSTDASPPPSRATAHGSRPMWLATPSSYRTCTDYSLPVSRRTAKDSVRHQPLQPQASSSSSRSSSRNHSANLCNPNGQAKAPRVTFNRFLIRRRRRFLIKARRWDG